MSTSSNQAQNAAWRQALPTFALVLLAILLVYRETGLAMVEIWERSETFAHAFVVPPIALWLIWRQRAQLALQRPTPSLAFLLPMGAMGLLWLLGELAAVNAATQLAFTALLVLSVPLCFGGSVARTIAFPLGFLFFAVPIGEFLMPQFMSWTADFTVTALRLSGIPVYREGLQFVIPSGNWSVVEACSGIRYLMASVMVGALFAYLNYRSLWRRWIFVGFSVLLPIVANWMRAYLTVLLGHVSGNELATGADHLVYGWAFFGIIMLAMFMVGARWSEPEASSNAIPSPSLEKQGGGSFALSTLFALVVVTLPALWSWQLAHTGTESVPILNVPAGASGGWAVDHPTEPMLSPHFEHPAASVQTRYRRAQEEVGLYIAYYRQQSYSSKLISSSNELVGSKSLQWAHVNHGAAEILEPALRLRTAELRALASEGVSRPQRLLVWQVYWINGLVLSSDWQAKIAGAVFRLLGRGDDAAVLVFYTDKGDADDGDQRLRRFLQDNWGSLDSALSETRAGRTAPGR